MATGKGGRGSEKGAKSAKGSKSAAAAAAPRPRQPKGSAGPGGGAPAFPADQFEGVLRENEPLLRHTTYRIGGPARYHFTPGDAAAAVGALRWARANGVPILALGLGSNVLVRDGGFPGLVLKIGKGLDGLSHRAGTWKVGGGLPIPVLARKSAEEGFAGIHRLIGVPGSVGGGVYLNAGAHGNDFASVLVSATVVDPSGAEAEMPRAKIPFGYRSSGLGDRIVLGCVLRLEKGEPGRLKAEIGELLRRRKAGTPFDQPCCGSVFRNPAESTAGRLIDQCGLKGRRVGGAEISTMHANYIVNRGNASADDVLKLIDIARTAVFKEFGVELELEVKVLGEAK